MGYSFHKNQEKLIEFLFKCLFVLFCFLYCVCIYIFIDVILAVQVFSDEAFFAISICRCCCLSELSYRCHLKNSNVKIIQMFVCLIIYFDHCYRFQVLKQKQQMFADQIIKYNCSESRLYVQKTIYESGVFRTPVYQCEILQHSCQANGSHTL